MTKAEIASYLVALHTLLEAQSKVGANIPSQALAEEYRKHWELLKDTIKQESENETRKRSDDHISDKARADLPRDRSGVRISDRLDHQRTSAGADVRGPGDRSAES